MFKNLGKKFYVIAFLYVKTVALQSAKLIFYFEQQLCS